MSARPVRWALFLLLAASGVAHARPRARYDLVRPRACLAGGITGEPGVSEWRLQLGVFADESGAIALEKTLARRGIRADHFLAAWLANGEDEPQVVVSSAVYPDASAARRAARRLQARGVTALVRPFERHP